MMKSVVGTIISFLGIAFGFVTEHAWVLIVFAAGLFGTGLMQKVSKK